MTTEEFVKKAKVIHENKYDYSNVSYKTNIDKVKIICPEHGAFLQKPHAHITQKHGCKLCGKINSDKKQTLTNIEFLQKVKQKHGNKYDYSLVDYKHSNTKIKIICFKHGLLEILPHGLLNNGGCEKCGIDRMILPKKVFIKRANKIHKNKYDYSLVKYKSIGDKIEIICKIHGNFKQIANAHMRGQNCPKCAGKVVPLEDFIKRANQVHKNKYDYSLIKYKNSHEKVKIICPKHGVFIQTLHNHTKQNGTGCPTCSESKGEKEVAELLTKKNIKFIRQHKFEDCKNYKTNRKLPFDFYLPIQNICIEYDGKQHEKEIKYFGGKEAFNKLKLRDKIKTKYCKNKRIKLLRIKYNENIILKLQIMFS